LPLAAAPVRLGGMDQSVPLIYAPRPRSARVLLSGRLLWLATSLGCLAVLAVALVVHPDRSGVGSHRQAGFVRCQFLDRSGVPCPTCGMTTSFAYFARGQVIGSLYVQPMGAVLAVLSGMTFWGGLYIALTGRPVYRMLGFIPARCYLIPLFALFVLGWAWKIGIHITGHDGWW